MKVGDLVKYFNPGYQSRLVGIILEIDKEGDGSLEAALSPYKVRWQDHCASVRDWYGEQELVSYESR